MYNSGGAPVNGVYGMCKMLLNLLKREEVTHAAAALDTPHQGGFRKKIYSNYKCNRKETPEELRLQIPLAKEALECFSLRTFFKDGFEADDIMATFATKVDNMRVVLVGSDKDLTQLVSRNVSLFDPVKGALLDEEGVLNKMGVSPHLVPDLQALCGDSSDNIPGVPGIGPKTAAKLIAQEGSLEEMLMEAVSGAGSDRLRKVLEYEEEARISKNLATLRRDVPLEWDLEDLRKKESGSLRWFFEQNGFYSLMSLLDDF